MSQPSQKVAVPGFVVLGSWVVLVLATGIVAGFADAKVAATETAKRSQQWANAVERRAEAQPANPFRPQQSDIAQEQAAAAWRHSADLQDSLIAISLAWVLCLGWATLGTLRWLRARDSWGRIRSWHGVKLLMLLGTFTLIALLFGSSASASDFGPAEGTLIITNALVLIVGAGLLIRTTWNWLTGREAAAPDGSIDRRPTRKMIVLGLVVGLLAVGGIAAFTIIRQPRTYADCVLRGMKHATTATATRALDNACRQKFGMAPSRTTGTRGPRRPQPPRPPWQR